MKERLQKFLAGAGVASRRKAEGMIAAGWIAVNGTIITKPGTMIDPTKDLVTFRDEPIANVTEFRYLVLNKPAGVVCSKVAQRREQTVYDLVRTSRDLAIAGRLDKDSEGLVLLTNDGELVNTLTHPRYQTEKEYHVRTIKPLDDTALNKLRRGVRLSEGKATADVVEKLHGFVYRIVIHQGWNRQIRRMIGEVRNDVVSLKRIRLGKLTLGNLPLGASIAVNREEIV